MAGGADVELMAIGSSLPGQYAAALLDLAGDGRAQDAALDELRGVLDLARRLPDLGRLMGSPLVSFGRKHALLARALAAVSPVVASFLAVLVRHGRFGLLDEVADACCHRLEAMRGQIEVRVLTANPLDESQRRELTALAAEALGATPVLAEQIEPGLLGGLRLMVGDKVIDASVRGQLQRLQAELSGVNSRFRDEVQH